MESENGQFYCSAMIFIRNCNRFPFSSFGCAKQPLVDNERARGQEMQEFLMYQSGKQVIRSVLLQCQNQLGLIFSKFWGPGCAFVFLFFLLPPTTWHSLKKKLNQTKQKKTPKISL